MNLVTIILGLFTLIFGSLYGWKYNSEKALKDSNSALRELVGDRDLQLKDAITKHTNNLDRIKDLETTVKVLDARVTQAPSIIKMASQQALQHKQLLTALGDMTNQLGSIAKAMVNKDRA